MVELKEKESALVRRLAQLGLELDRIRPGHMGSKRNQVESEIADTIRKLRGAGLSDDDIRRGVSEERGRRRRASTPAPPHARQP